MTIIERKGLPAVIDFGSDDPVQLQKRWQEPQAFRNNSLRTKQQLHAAASSACSGNGRQLTVRYGCA
ncbi:hypothetical protein PQQ73_00595 [Paraburkholderia strydomiana]|uniref:Uncharacterized protein n=1 Tax=Paraburkholderia strydomiana TaxID=1245417 RepID=A0ABW9E9M9_9BURK